MVQDFTAYTEKQLKEHGHFVPVVKSERAFFPMIYVCDFWILKEHFVELNDTMIGQEVNLTLKYNTYSTFKYQLTANMEKANVQN